MRTARGSRFRGSQFQGAIRAASKYRDNVRPQCRQHVPDGVRIIGQWRNDKRISGIGYQTRLAFVPGFEHVRQSEICLRQAVGLEVLGEHGEGQIEHQHTRITGAEGTVRQFLPTRPGQCDRGYQPYQLH